MSPATSAGAVPFPASLRQPHCPSCWAAWPQSDGWSVGRTRCVGVVRLPQLPQTPEVPEKPFMLLDSGWRRGHKQL